MILFSPTNDYCRLLFSLFEANPTYQNFFTFRDVPSLDQLRLDKRLKAHVRNVMYTIAMVVDNLDDPEVAQEMLDKIARSHIRRKVNEQHFDRLKSVLLGLLTDSLGSELMNQKAVIAWTKTYDLFTEAIVEQTKQNQ